MLLALGSVQMGYDSAIGKEQKEVRRSRKRRRRRSASTEEAEVCRRREEAVGSVLRRVMPGKQWLMTFCGLRFCVVILWALHGMENLY